MSIIRVPVLIPDGSCAMPAKASRVRRWIKEGKAKVVKSDLKTFAVQLVEEPSGRQTQDISLGIDPGSCFTGVAVQSQRHTLIGVNLNLPIIQVQKRSRRKSCAKKNQARTTD